MVCSDHFYDALCLCCSNMCAMHIIHVFRYCACAYTHHMRRQEGTQRPLAAAREPFAAARAHREQERMHRAAMAAAGLGISY